MLKKFIHILILILTASLPGNAQNIIFPGDYASIAVSDFNGDQNPDILFAGNSATGNSGIAINSVNGTFRLSDIPIPENGTSVGWAYLNSDAYIDFFLFGSGKSVNAVYFNNGHGSFTRSSQFSSYYFLDPDVSVIDIENDGDADLFVTAWDYTQSRRFSDLFLNDGEGNFTAVHPDIIRKGFGSSVWADVNADGLADLLVNGDGDSFGDGGSFDIYRLYLNNGDGNFTEKQVFQNYRQISVGDGSRFADWNNDGSPDIVLTGWSSSENRQVTCVFLNDGSGSFTRSNESDIIPGVSESSIEVADIDKDGRIDLLLTGYSGDYSRRVALVYINETTVQNKSPLPPSLLTQTPENGSIMLSWEPGSDEKTAQKSLSYNLSLRSVSENRWLISPDATIEGTNNGQRKVTGIGNVFLNESRKVSGLPEGKYAWTVQTIDAAYAGSEFPEEIIFCIKDTSRLRQLVNEAKDLLASAIPGENPGQYPPASITRLQDTITMVEVWIADIRKEASEIELPLNAAMQTFLSAKTGVDVTSLSALIIAATDVKTMAISGERPGNYSASDLGSLENAIQKAGNTLNTAEQITELTDIPAMTDSVNAALIVLQESLDLFYSRAVIIDMGALSSEIEKAISLHDSIGTGSCNVQYRHESRRQLAIAIEVALKTHADTAHSQSEVDLALTTLQAAENVFLSTIITPDYKRLKVLIDSASLIYDNALASEYISGAKFKLMKAIYNAKIVYQNSSLCEELLNESIAGMENVITEFNNSRITGINDTIVEIKIYPIPADEKLFIEFLPVEAEIKIHNALGKMIFADKPAKATVQINTSAFPEGLYLIRIRFSTGDFETRKLIIKRT